MKRSDFVCLSALSAIANGSPTPSHAAPAGLPTSIAGVAIPDSHVARQAAIQARDVEHPHVFRHSVRSFLFAELISRARKIKHDSEMLYVSCMLHDIGLSKQFATPHLRFEIDGADLARKMLLASGATAERGRIAWDAVVLHSMYGIARFKEPEVRLASAGVITDVGAAFVQDLEKAQVRQVLAAMPRHGFNDAFLSVLSDYAHRKPDTVGGTFVEDVAVRTVHGYDPGNFYDEMKAGDAFAQAGFD
jgi:hypothetical protein